MTEDRCSDHFAGQKPSNAVPELIGAADRSDKLAKLIETARTAVREGGVDDALPLWEGIREQFQDAPEAYASIGGAFRESGRFDEAEEVLLDAIRRFPDDAWVRYHHARIAEGRRDWGELLFRSESIRLLFPAFSHGYTLAGIALSELGSVEEARELLEDACAKFPGEYWPAYHRARAAVYAANWSEATRLFAQLNERFPEHPSGFRASADALQRAGQPDQADAVLCTAVERFPAALELAVDYATLAERQLQSLEAVDRWRQVLTNFPEEPIGYRMLATALLRLGKCDDAAAIVDVGITRFPLDGALVLLRGQVLIQGDDDQGSVALWSQLLSENPEARSQFLLSGNIAKPEALASLGQKLGIQIRDPWAQEAANDLERISSIIEPLSNRDFAFVDHRNVARIEEFQIFPSEHRHLAPPICASHVHPSFAIFQDRSFVTEMPGLSGIRIPDGYVCNFGDFCLILDRDGETVFDSISSRYGRLLYFSEKSLKQCLKSAKFVEETVIPILDDIRPLNYCHWMIDWLPRLLIGTVSQFRHTQMLVATTPITAEFQRETLELCGFGRGRVVELRPFEAIQARELVVPNDLKFVPHPGHRAAPCVLSYLRSAMGQPPEPRACPRGAGNRIYISRSDAPGRRIVNEGDLVELLSGAGYRKITLDGLPVVEQARIFASASCVVSVHGAGLVNFLFAPAAARLLEIIPESYGMATYYHIAASAGNAYMNYVSKDLIRAEKPSLDDICLDIADFERRCRDFYST